MDAAPPPTYEHAIFFDVASAWVPYANDLPIMIGAGVRFFDIHEVWIRGGYFPPVGDDRNHAFGVTGYRIVLRPHRVVRPMFGALFAGVPATCFHDAMGNPSCTNSPLFIFAGTAGVRFEPKPWLGFFAQLSVGSDSYPNIFGMVEAGVTFALPLR